MTLSEFVKRDAFEQSFCVALTGTYIDHYFDGTFDVTLYQVEDFYVESFVHLHRKEMYGFKAFQSIDLLAPYLDKIDVSAIVPNNIKKSYEL